MGNTTQTFNFYGGQSGFQIAQSIINHYPPISKTNQEEMEKISRIPKKKILVLAVNPKNTGRLRLDEEIRELEESIRRANEREKFDLSFRLAVRYKDFRRALIDKRPHIVHIIGHGNSEELLVEDEKGDSKKLSKILLTDLLHLSADWVETVIISACFSESLAVEISRYIPFVIGMRDKMPDKAAIEFAIGFFDALAAGLTVKKAFEFGKNAVMNLSEAVPLYQIPVLIEKST